MTIARPELEAENARLQEARDYYAGLYAERCGMLLQAQAERDAAEKRVSEAEKVMKIVVSWADRGTQEFVAAQAFLTKETDNGK